jgi:hypothetical protein
VDEPDGVIGEQQRSIDFDVPFKPVDEDKFMFKHCADLRNRVLAIAVAGALGVSGAALAVAPVGAGIAPVRSAGAAPAAQFGVLTRATTLNRGDVVKSAVPLT